MTLKEALLLLGSEDEKDDPAMLPRDVVDELLKRGLLYMRGPKHIDLTDDGEKVYERAKDGKPTPELD